MVRERLRPCLHLSASFRGAAQPLARVGEVVESGGLAAAGVEVVLTGSTCQLGPRPPLARLAWRAGWRRSLPVPALRRLRLSSPGRAEIDPASRNLLGSEPRLMPHLHLAPARARPDPQRMKRRHSPRRRAGAVARLRARRADIAVGADLIAGFPTKAPHPRHNLSIIGELGVVHGHVFPIQRAARPPAARMPQLPAPLITERAAAGAPWWPISAGLAARADWPAAAVLAERDGHRPCPQFRPCALFAGTVPGTVVTVTPQRIVEGMLE